MARNEILVTKMTDTYFNHKKLKKRLTLLLFMEKSLHPAVHCDNPSGQPVIHSCQIIEIIAVKFTTKNNSHPKITQDRKSNQNNCYIKLYITEDPLVLKYTEHFGD